MSIDIQHLERATIGDRVLETELLNLFREQLLEVSGLLETGGGDGAVALHRLKGAAYAVGATPLASALAEAETALRQAEPDRCLRAVHPCLAPALSQALEAVDARLIALGPAGLAKAGESG